MKIAAAVLTHNAYANDRYDLFVQTVDTLTVEGVQVVPVDNGSTDGTAETVARMGGYCSTGRNTTCGHGTNICARVAVGLDADLCVLSDDDMVWGDGWADRLRAWWADAPQDVVLTGCHLEPLFPWNAVHGRIVCGGVPGLIRASTGAASWSFRSDDWPKIGPVPERQQGWGDVPACQRVGAAGLKVAQLDLATHVGRRSSWGNRTRELYGWELDPVRALLEGDAT